MFTHTHFSQRTVIASIGVATISLGAAYFLLRPTPTSVQYLKHVLVIRHGSGDHFHKLPNGRRLCYRTYGDAGGRPVLFLHGMPGSRYLFPGAEAVCKENGIFVVVPDRPGYGFSDFDPNSSTLSVAQDVLNLMEYVLRSYKYETGARFEVVGYSNGGPFALAMAYHFPQLLTRCTLVCSGGFVDPPSAIALLPPVQKVAHTLSDSAPMVLKAFWTIMASYFVHPSSYFEGFESALGAEDKEYLRTHPDVREYWVDLVTGETFRQGIRGFLHDVFLVMGRTSPYGFGFDVGQIDTRIVPVTQYVAKGDTLVTSAQSDRLRELIPRSGLIRVDGGHLSVLETVFREFLDMSFSNYVL